MFKSFSVENCVLFSFHNPCNNSFFKKILLTYTCVTMLVSGTQQSESVIHIIILSGSLLLLLSEHKELFKVYYTYF